MDLQYFVYLFALSSLGFLSGFAQKCESSHWQCDDGTCKLRAWRCDGAADCLDGSDEMDCSCTQGEFECADGSRCVKMSAVCDGLLHCTDGSDEVNCTEKNGCLVGDWMCRNKICIPRELQCNGANDCADNSDEEGCGSCEELGVRCPNGVCLNPSERCDGRAQCSDGRDEPATCGKKCLDSNGGCRHMCKDQPWGTLCSCLNGLKLSANGADCEDIDECSQSYGPCMHICINTPGSFVCRCRHGFQLQESGACQAQGNVTKILTAKKGAIGFINTKTRMYETIYVSNSDPVALAFDIGRNSVYWADNQGNIHKAVDHKSRILYAGQTVKSLACDWLSGQLYWTNTKQKAIAVGTSDGSAVATIMAKDVDPVDLVLLPRKSTLFWMNKGAHGAMTIERAGMDGSRRTSLVVVTAQSPRSLTLDVAAERLYWISVFKMSIETVKVDGTGRYTFWDFFKGRTAQNLAVFDGWFYWADEKRLWQAQQNQPKQKTFILKASLPILTVYHQLQQPKGYTSPCVKSRCQLCLPSPENSVGFTCDCPEGHLPMPHGTCEHFKLAYATSTSLYTLEFKDVGPVKMLLFTTDEDIKSFDMDLSRGWVVWANGTGHVKGRMLNRDQSVYIPTLGPVCTVRVDQRTGNLYWISCDKISIGVTVVGLLDHDFSKRLYHAGSEVGNLYVDWQRSYLYWLEGGQILRMRLSLNGGNAKAVLSFEEKGVGQITLDRKSNSFLWNTESGLQIMSLLKMRKYSAGPTRTVPGSVMAAYEPYMVTMLDNIITLWERSDGRRVRGVAMENGVIGVNVALQEVMQDQDVPPTQPTCTSPSVLCRGTALCISYTQLCDGKRDCPDGSDEASCIDTCAKMGDFLCKDRRKCIEGNLVCDARSHCHDGSDEVDCPTVATEILKEASNVTPLWCRVGTRQCKDGSECVLYSHVCDGETDCKDGSDEEDCDLHCNPGQFHCAHGRKCINKKQVCDGTPQCQDRSDEMDCFKPSESCSHPCDNKTRCVPDSFLCDGERDCVDGSDEGGCASKVTPLWCRVGTKPCKDGSECVLYSHVCDGETDCKDGSDEEDCDLHCNPGQFHCAHGRKCINKKQVCDGTPQCQDRSDEMDCFKPSESCSHPCDDKTRCVPESFLCDGERDCVDGSDEGSCDSKNGDAGRNAPANEPSPTLLPTQVPSCRSPSVLCRGTALCVSQTQLCDGKRDCPDGSDEASCIDTCAKIGDFLCTDRRKCIEWNLVCDGRSHCHDGSDEVSCPTITIVTKTLNATRLTCRAGKPCQDGRECVLYSHVCDGEIDCKDGSDEEDCDLQCKTGQFQCVQGRTCIDIKQVCDGTPQCPDQSDEVDCWKPSRSCALRCDTNTRCIPEVFICNGMRDCWDGSDEAGCASPTPPTCISPSVLCRGTALCVSQTQLCDGKRDCPDGSDEASCIDTCAKIGDFLCTDRRKCIERNLVCDGRSHCHDGSDEVACPTITVVTKTLKVTPLLCRVGTKPCKDGSECVLYSHVCDGEIDCKDGSDEEDCDLQCNPGQVQCVRGKKCIDLKQVCDGTPQCPDQSDEVDCWKPSRSCALRCDKNTRCIPEVFICNGMRDCWDGSDEAGCATPTPAPSCESPSMMCRGTTLCISQTKLCDGKKDCPDGSDEKPCFRSCPYQGDFLCKDRRKCIKRDLVCDGRPHCRDGSDEVDCPTVGTEILNAAPKVTPLKCVMGSKACKDGSECVLYSHVCDGEIDCKDGSDEEGCQIQCKTGQFQCAHGKKCIDVKKVCDGTPQCQDRSDEMDCFKPSKSCSHRCDDRTRCVPEGFLCDGERDCVDGTDEADCGYPTPAVRCKTPSMLCRGGSLCISQAQLCDGNRDCPDGFDEESCMDHCAKSGDFLCTDRRKCIEGNLVCDGRSHCHDGSDEVVCPIITVAPKTFRTRAAPLWCRVGTKACKDGSECVLYSHVCDGELDCKDGSDEEGCDLQCNPGQFHCAHGRKCINKKQVCDGTPQCQDRSDEMDCFKPSESCSHPCDNKTRCVPGSFLCDGERDCVDGSDEAGCPPSADASPDSSPSPRSCASPSVLCRGTALCLSQTQLCDGKKDCPDGSDEDACIDACTDPAHFLCKDRRKCIDRSLVCDGRSHCPDGSDEEPCPACALRCDQGTRCLTHQQFCDGKQDCKDGSDEKHCYNADGVSTAAPLWCRVGTKACEDGSECVLYSHVCDGEIDCKDGSDEEGCDRKCKTGQFQCAHGRKCIDIKQVCDGTPQCQDRSDEVDCLKETDGCSHRCDDQTRCIPESFLCDGEKDCVDGSDEAGCVPEECASGQFSCRAGQCVSLTLRCDGHADCRDHSDEEGCAKPPRCPLEQRCPHSHECLLKEWFCDGEKDCSDGFDEKNCKAHPLKCGEFQWTCASKTQCVPATWRCDGMKDCKDESDEAGCGPVKCPTRMFQCGSGDCVDPGLVCDTVTNCPDGSDEGPGCLTNNCSSPSRPWCDHYCISTPHGARCGCRAGFRLQPDGLFCKDLDECKEISPAVCSHTCLNTHGSYLCHCYPGYLLEPDGRTCKTAGEEPRLLASVQYELLLLGLRSSDLHMLIPSSKKPIFSVDYDWSEQRVFWVSLDEESIRWAIHSNNVTQQGAIVKGVKSDSIAVDWVGRNLYWVDGVAGQILAVRLSTSVVKPQDYSVVLDEDLEQPCSLVLLPQKGMMFWSEIGSEPQIERSGMDGSERKVVVSRSLSWPVSVTVDILTDRIYWTDEKLKCIASATLDGEDIRLLQLAEMPSPFSVAVFNDMVYWSDTKRRTIQGANKNNGKNRKVLLKRPGQPFGLRAAHPLMQAKLPNPCEKMRCSHLCLLAPRRKAVCRCPSGLLLAVDGFTCSPPVDSSSSFLLLLSPTMVTQIYLRGLRGEVGLKKWPEHRALALPGVNEATGLDVALRERALYLADAGLASVSRLRLSSSGLEPGGRVLQLQGDAVMALAVDWITRNLYWSSSKQPLLHVTSAGGEYTAVVLQSDSQDTTSIALHPPTGRLCFTAMGKVGGKVLPQVDCAYMDGRNRTLLSRKALLPSSLTFSNDGTKLYLADIGAGVIAKVGIDGSNYKEYKTGPALIVSFARSDNILLWVTLENDVTKVWYSDGFQPKQLWFEVKTNIVELKAYSRTSQKGSNSCSERNGGCSHLCLPYPGGRMCRCAQDHLSVNGTECVPNQPCPAGSKPCRDGHKCLPSDKFCDRVPDCQDRSDEDDCVYSRTKPGLGPKAGGSPAKRPPSLGSADVTTPPAQEDDGALVRKLDSQSCDAEQCNSHGKCVTREGEPVCECALGYSGEFCQDGGSSSSHVALTLSLLFITAGIIIGILVLRRRARAAAMGKATEKETLMTNMEERATYVENFSSDLEECTACSQNFSNEMYNPNLEEELVTSVN